MTAQSRFSALETTQPPEVGAASAPAANHPARLDAKLAAYEDAVDVALSMPQPQWHVRHARKLIAAAVVLVIAAAYGAYRTWQSYLVPSDRIAAEGRQGKQAAVPAIVPAVAVAPPAPAKVPSAVVPVATPVARIQTQAEPIAPASRHVPVTHTRPEPAPVAAAAVPAASVPAAAKVPACPEAIVALGLCTPEREIRK